MKSSTKVRLARLWNYPSEIGDRYGVEWLTYNPGVFLEFALVARRNSPLFTRALVDTFPEANFFNDIGCGTGQFVKALRKLGKTAEGFEYSRMARIFAKIIGVEVGSFDLMRSPVIYKLKKADVVYSLEVGEHVPLFLSGRFVDTLILAGETVVFTAAGLGQKGHGHINCQPKEYWAGLFRERGYVKSDRLEAQLLGRLAMELRLSSFLRDNLQVFISK